MGTLKAGPGAWASLLWPALHPAQALLMTHCISFLFQLGRAGSLTAFLFVLHPTAPQQPVPCRVGDESSSAPWDAPVA